MNGGIAGYGIYRSIEAFIAGLGVVSFQCFIFFEA
jgi:hypothetical protein